jgi:hypothetical protein
MALQQLRDINRPDGFIWQQADRNMYRGTIEIDRVD